MANTHTVQKDSKGSYVVVKKGDTLSHIAAEFKTSYSIKNYQQLATINKLSNPNLIYVNQKIYLKLGSSGSSSTTKTNTNKPTITAFGELSTSENTLFATWTWHKSSTTASYKVLWTYDTGNGVWFEGTNSTITVDKDAESMSRQSTYSVPSGAKKVRFKVKPIAKTKKRGKKEVEQWTASWSDTKTWTNDTPLEAPGTPKVELDKLKLTASLENIDITGATEIEFEIVKDNTQSAFKTAKAAIVRGDASYSCSVNAGSEYKVRCRACKNKEYSEWSQYSSPVETMPAVPSGITTIRADSETSIYLKWAESKTAESYEIEYTTEKDRFDVSSDTQSVTVPESGEPIRTDWIITGLETGHEYFFRVRAVKGSEKSGWCEIKSCVVGEDPAAPTTWSSTTTAVVGEPVNLYWVHNSVDGSSQTYAELELIIGETKETYTIENTTDEDEKDKTSVYSVNTTEYPEGTKIQWRVRTAGATKAYGDWSIQRTIEIYAPPTLELSLTDADANAINVLTAFPAYIKGIAGPTTQAPIGYHLSITANETYETTDNMGNDMTVSVGDEVYSKYFDTFEALLVELSANNIDLENEISYTITGTVSMNSGLTATSSLEFTVNWLEAEYVPNAEIGVDMDTYTASIRPYCENQFLTYRKVTKRGRTYTLTDEEVEEMYGEPVNDATVTVNSEPQQVYLGTTSEGEDVYYCMVEGATPVTDVYLSVYRREFDGSFTELGTGLDGEKTTTITDPHPALDFARYRIVSKHKTTGAVSYFDPPGHYVGCPEIIIQWDEAWTPFDTTEDAALEQPPWTGSLLRLPYNIDVSDSTKPDVELIEYIGRSHPVSYYGTQLGQSATWSTVIDKNDEETVYALRRLARWAGDVYVREPSGTGYWANITVSFSQKHLDQIIPVSFAITRVEGGA